MLKNLKQLRLKRDMRQTDIAVLCNVSAATYRRWEWGKQTPRAQQLINLATALGTTEERLLYDDSKGE
ncbi:MAG: helix-turn-helix transcriptional regulator [Clostridia bacterium]|nr:helix-turn-helix transcriptional regulator [Clostridia bacterium]